MLDRWDMKKFIWLFGENVGQTADNNSFYLWKHLVNKQDDIEKYFIMEKNPATMAVYRTLDARCKQYVVWRNSAKHFGLYFNADMFFVSLSYRDVRPEKYLFREFNFLTETPIVYLQHGTLAMKKIGYKGDSYNNNLFRFFYYNPLIKEQLEEEHDFKDYQLYYGEYHPRYQELLKRSEVNKGKEKDILWFLTWREYKSEEFGNQKLYLTVKHILSNPQLHKYLEEHGCSFKLCLHRGFQLSELDELKQTDLHPNIQILYANEVNVMDELASCKLLITDYSSVGFDFSFLGKPVLLYMPDLEEYEQHREFYCDVEELKEYSIQNASDLMQSIIKEDYGKNPFFCSRLPQNINYEYVRNGGHMDRIYDEYAHMQHHKITFLGYNFYGIGGTVIATRALAEALLEKGYLVQLQSLVQRTKAKHVPYGLTMKAFYSSGRKNLRNRLKRFLFRGQRHCYGYLKYDKDQAVLSPYAGYGLKKWLQTCNSETVVSTRESLHLFLADAPSELIKNKIYFYHCQAAVLEQIFPGCMAQLKEKTVDKAVFVSETNKQDLEAIYGYHHYNQSLVLGNALDSSRMIRRDEICDVEEKEVYRGIYLIRLGNERKDDIENLLNYGRYLKEKNCHSIVIDVYGKGDLAEEFYTTILKEGLEPYINYCGFIENPKEAFAEHDAVVDFSRAHSFGMPYIEGVLNGKPVFCMENTGSLEVMAQIPDAFIRSFEDLTEKMLNLSKWTKEELEKNYDVIAEKYSREIIGDKFLQYINGEQ